MSNPTTPFSWQMPTATDLVTDLPADFEVFGQAVATSMADLLGGTTGQILSKTTSADMDFTWITNDVGDITAVTAGTGISGGGTSGAVTITNDMATTITASGDIVVGTGSGTYDNLPIGTTGQVLTADTTVSPYKVKWATPATAASGLTLITSATFSNVASVTIDSVFSSTYKSYQVYFDLVSASAGNDELLMQMRYGATTQSSAVYLGSQFQYNRNNSLTTAGYVSTTSATILQDISTGGTPSLATINFSQVGQSSQNASFYGNGLDAQTQSAAVFAGLVNTGQTYTGLLLKGSTANITGRYAVYGLAN